MYLDISLKKPPQHGGKQQTETYHYIVNVASPLGNVALVATKSFHNDRHSEQSVQHIHNMGL